MLELSSELNEKLDRVGQTVIEMCDSLLTEQK